MPSSPPSCTAVILPPQAMSFHSIAGLPLIQRIALSALRGEFEAVVALAPGDGGALRALFSSDPRTAAIAVVGDVRTAAVSTEQVALIPSNYLVTGETLRRVRHTELNGQPLRFGPAEPGIVLGTRRQLDDPMASRPAQLGALENDLCLPVANAADAAAAERALLRTLGSPDDGPIARFDRSVSTRISRYLVRTPLRPNHITAIGTTIGLLGAWCLTGGTYTTGLLGTLLFWCAVIIDGCDGEVARLKFQESRLGYLFDVTTDNIVHAAIFAGLGIGLYRADPDSPFLALAALLLGGFACATAATLGLLVPDPPAGQPPPRTRRGRLRRRLLRGFEALMNRDFVYLLLLLALLGRLHWFLWAAAFGTYVYAGALVLVYHWRDAE